MAQKTLWFKAKGYGWGWFPITWQGWAIIGLYLVALLGLSASIDKKVVSSTDLLLHFFPTVIVLTIFLIIICWVTGEKPRWRWGGK